MAKPWTIEQRFVTKAARDAADVAIDKLDTQEPMTTYLDTWLATYRAVGGIEKTPERKRP